MNNQERELLESKQLEDLKDFLAKRDEYLKVPEAWRDMDVAGDLSVQWTGLLNAPILYPAVANHILDHASDLVRGLIDDGVISLLIVDELSYQKVAFVLFQDQKTTILSCTNFTDLQTLGRNRFPNVFKEFENAIDEKVNSLKKDYWTL